MAPRDGNHVRLLPCLNRRHLLAKDVGTLSKPHLYGFDAGLVVVPTLDRVHDTEEARISFWVDSNVDLATVAVDRDTLGADSRSQPLGERQHSRSVGQHDPHLHRVLLS